MKKTALLFLIVGFAVTAFAQTRSPLTFDRLMEMERISDPQLSPDGKTAAFVVTTHDPVGNTVNSNIHVVSLDNGAVRQLTSAPKTNNNPRWAADGKTIFFVSTRDGESQIWKVPAAGGDAVKVSTISTEASSLVLSADGRLAAFASDVFPDCPTDDCNKKRNEEMAASKVKARLITRLPYRIWNYWKDGKRSHAFLMSTAGGPATDMTPGDYDTPPVDLGGSRDYDFSPDGKEFAFTRNTDSLIAISTNNDIFVVPVAGGTAKRITGNPANDSQPLYSPDGKYLAHRAMNRPGFEADRRQLVLYDRKTGKHRSLTADVDYSIDEVAWAPDSKSLFVTADDKGNHSIFRVWLSGKTETVIDKGYNHSIQVFPDGKSLLFVKESINQPADIHRIDVNGQNLQQVTRFNEKALAGLEMHSKEDFWFDGAGETKVHGWIVRPPGFVEGKTYPVVYLVHGGPQGQWGDQFHYRWSAQMFAGRGYVVLMVNPRGSTGYGQQFTDEITGDWGGKVYEDLMNGLDAALKNYPFMDGNRVAAAGASYGGYMMNWMSGQTGRFRCIVNHDGVFNPKSMYGTTEELWFPEWEFAGTPYKNPELFEKWSPLNHVSKFKTPTLVVHGQLDFRVDVSEGFQLFTALQRQGIESKLLYFPDEGHWVTKPANAGVWYATVLDWIGKYTQ